MQWGGGGGTKMQGGGVWSESRTLLWRSRCGGRKTTHLSTYGTTVISIDQTTWEAKLSIMTTQCALRANDIHHLALRHGKCAHTHTNIHAHLFWNTPAERADVWRGFPFVSSPPRRHLMCLSVIYGWWVSKAIYSFQSDKEPLCD